MKWISVSTGAVLAFCLMSASVWSAGAPSVEQALSIKPMQIDFTDYSTPTADKVASCKLEALTGNLSGWKLIDENGQTLRIFADSNGDKNLDQWRYFKEGVEVYRDIDSNGNNKPDQYRWFNMAGSRWGLDENEDKRIESWKQLSAEEAAAEMFAALRTGDKPRFAAVQMTADDIAALSASDEDKQKLAKFVQQAAEAFDKAVNAKTFLGNGEFIQFTGDKPSAIPAEGSDGIVVFENSSSFVKLNDKDVQLSNGTLVQCGSVWKSVFCPAIQTGGADAPIMVAFMPGASTAPNMPNGENATPDKQQQLIVAMDKVDQQLAQETDPAAKAALHKRRATIVEKLAAAATGDEKTQWFRQLADGLSVGTQMGELPEGPETLGTYADKFKEDGNMAMAAYFKFQQMQSSHYLNMSAPDADWAKIQLDWYASLEKFIEEYPEAPETAEALLQLANSKEYAGQETEAMKWYQEIVSRFNQTTQSQKARGAIFRLSSVGKPMSLSGQTTNGKTLDLVNFKGYNVLIHYWTANSQSAITDAEILRQAALKYGKQKFQIIGVNLDDNADVMNQFVTDRKIPWYQIDGKGPDGPQASQMGIIAVPTMILVDAEGRIVNRNVQINDLDSSVEKLVNPPTVPNK